MKTNNILIAFLFLLSFQLQGQNLGAYLPSNPAAVVHIKPGVIQSKVNMAELSQLPLVENMWNSLQGMTGASSDEAFSLSDLGINPDKEMYFYASPVENGIASVMVMHSADEEKLKEVIKNAGFEEGGNLKMKSLSVHTMESAFMAYGDGVVLSGMINKEPEPTDPYAEFNFDEEVELEEVESDDMVEEEIEIEEKEINIDVSARIANQEWMDNTMQGILNSGAGLNPIKSAKLKAGKGVVTAWMDYGVLLQGLSKYTGTSNPMMDDLYSNLYTGMEAFVDMQFNDGELLMDTKYTFPEQLTRGVDLTAGKVNKKFRKYIKGDNLLGVYSMALNTEAYGNIIKESFLQAMDAMPQAMGMGRDLAPLLGVIIDEEAIYNFFKGDMVVAFTGVNVFEKTSTTYEYDDDFNPIEKQVTSEEKIPEFTAMVSVGDLVNMKRILNIGKKMGVMEEAGSYYKVMNPMGFDVFMTLKDDILLISNDTKLITQNLNSGVKNPIAKQQWKRIQKNSMFFFWDVPSSLNMASEFGLPIGAETVNASRESIKEITWSSPRNQGSNMDSAMRMTFVNEKENALKLILNFLNDMFFPSEGKTSM